MEPVKNIQTFRSRALVFFCFRAVAGAVGLPCADRAGCRCRPCNRRTRRSENRPLRTVRMLSGHVLSHRWCLKRESGENPLRVSPLYVRFGTVFFAAVPMWSCVFCVGSGTAHRAQRACRFTKKGHPKTGEKIRRATVITGKKAEINSPVIGFCLFDTVGKKRCLYAENDPGRVLIVTAGHRRLTAVPGAVRSFGICTAVVSGRSKRSPPLYSAGKMPCSASSARCLSTEITYSCWALL